MCQKIIMDVFPASLTLYFENAENGDESLPMNIEWLRLQSFASVRKINVRPIQLARAGFFHTGASDEVRCFSCGARRSGWKIGDNLDEIHRQISPFCKHANDTDNTNVAVPRETGTGSSSGHQETQKTKQETRPVKENGLNTCCHGYKTKRFVGDRFLERMETQHQPKMQAQNMATNTVHSSVKQIPNGMIAQQKSISHGISVSESSTEQIHHSMVSTVSSSATNGHSIYRRSCKRSESNSNFIIPVQNGNGSFPEQRRSENESNVAHNTNETSQPSTYINPLSNHPIQDTANPTCTVSADSCPVGASVVQRLSPLGVNFEKPKYPVYAVLTVRISSFSGWSGSQTPKLMAEAGFVYAGYTDYTRCFFCGGGLKNWEDGDDPWIEHARWFPKCVYLRQNKGVVFIQLVQETLDTEEKVRIHVQDNTKFSLEKVALFEKDIEELPVVQSVVQLGYSPERVKQVVKQLSAKEIAGIHSTDVLLKLITDKRSTDSYGHGSTISGGVASTNTTETEECKKRQLLEENRRLRRNKMCRICEEEDASITFLPCAHLVCCDVCSQAMRRCPVCRVTIQGSIKTWLT
ncbi:baculoviral IAP repeat-containing protein 7-like [Ylistrum balloti]|uniref:baculoviral IAP repeat-containing protein 7-like n=1 Tax=Ylistrum balloti TaxID=509963 RepID=UPI002905CAA1|nr:baculoviral IAP repeat-containing protein 7-like [Ylistrum balloti]